MENQENVARLVPPVPALAIHDGDNVTVFQIENTGKMMWRPQGSTELEEMDIDKDLSTAFALCIEMLSGMQAKPLLEDVRKNAINDNAAKIAERVAQYLIDIKHIKPEDKDIHIKNVTSIVNGI